MNLTINSKEFLKALNFAGKTVPTSGITPIFECVLLECKKSGTMVITGSDSNSVFQTKTKMSEFDLDGQDVVKIAAPYDLLSKTLVNLPNAPVTITYIEEGSLIYRIELAFETDLFVIPCEDPDTYFKLPVVKDAESIKMPAQTLQRGIDQVINFVSTEDTLKPAQNGITLINDKGKIQFAATNGFMIGVHSISGEESESSTSIIVPGKFAKIISDCIGDLEAEVELSFSDQYLKVKTADWVAYSTLIDEKSPDYNRAIPVQYEYEAKINAEDIKTAIKRATVYGNPDSTMKLCFRGNNLFLSAEFHEKGLKCDQDIQIESDIGDFTIGINMKMFALLLKTVSGDFTLSLISPTRGLTVTPDHAEDEDVKYLIMPVMIMSETYA